jgi:hypothetical protein
MAKFTPCEECLSIASELGKAMADWTSEAREREANAGVPLVVRLMNMTDADWDQMARDFESSKAGQARRRAIEHSILTGHWMPTLPWGHGYSAR